MPSGNEMEYEIGTIPAQSPLVISPDPRAAARERRRGRLVCLGIMTLLLIASWSGFLSGQIKGAEWTDMALLSLVLCALVPAMWKLDAWMMRGQGLIISEVGVFFRSTATARTLLTRNRPVLCVQVNSRRSKWLLSLKDMPTRRFCVPVSRYPGLLDALESHMCQAQEGSVVSDRD